MIFSAVGGQEVQGTGDREVLRPVTVLNEIDRTFETGISLFCRRWAAYIIMRCAEGLGLLIFLAKIVTCCAFVQPATRLEGLLVYPPAPSSASKSRNGAGTRLQQVDSKTAPEGSLVLIEVTKKNARIYKSVAKGSVPEVVEPVDEWRLHEAGNSEHRSQGFVGHQGEQDDPLASSSYLVKFYMDELIDTIAKADSVLLVGHGRGKSNLAERLASAIYGQHPSLTEKIENVLRLDGKHITQNQLLALGRRHLLHTADPRKEV